MRQLLLSVAILLLLAGCSSKNAPEYNKSDIYWYQKMIHYVSVGDLDKADDYFTSLQSEHFASPLLKEAMLIMAQAHMDEEEYLLAKYYLDEFIKRFGDERNVEFAKFLKIKASFLAFKSINRDQKLLQETIEEARRYKQEFPASEFIPMVETIETKLAMAQFVLNNEIAALYQRRGKEDAAAFYRSKNEDFNITKDQIYVPKAWYDYLINW
ncbi:MAG: outer membrane protein assembly factor BamD [Epsilonproteobacteria bacterium]|nr:outer membrane protein assembly factor BamD [Campylobacterota bacterium]NPA63815.1 outer membrane protein assembly factor BamD [Campylobacterota bacterium]